MAGAMAELAQTWIDQPTRRDHVDGAITDLARGTVDVDSFDLISQSV